MTATRCLRLRKPIIQRRSMTYHTITSALYRTIYSSADRESDRGRIEDRRGEQHSVLDTKGIKRC